MEDMKTSIFCRKCLVKTMCNKECDHIRSVLYTLSVINYASLGAIPLVWSVGFGVAAIFIKESPYFLLLVFIGFFILAAITLAITSKLQKSINSRFNKDHISRYC